VYWRFCVLLRTIVGMDAHDFTINQLRDLLRKSDLGEFGTKTELITRLDAAFSREK